MNKTALHFKRTGIRRRPLWLPWAWRKITGIDGFENAAQKRDWQLVLDSRGISFRVCAFLGIEHLYVPPLDETRAIREINAFYQENPSIPPPLPVYPTHPHSCLAALFLAPLIIIYGLQHGWHCDWLNLPPYEDWNARGILDSVQVLIAGQWRRVVTSLTLHSSISHLCGNLFFGGIFIVLLARLAGIGRAMLLTMLAGAMGNVISVLFHDNTYRSLGFSTALFAMAGLLAGIMIWRAGDKKKMFMPLAAAMGLLAILGTEGQTTDYAAHISGLCSGFMLGVYEGWRICAKKTAIPQFIAGMAAILIPVIAWIAAFHS